METKKEIRRELIAQRDRILPEKRSYYSEEMIKRLNTIPEFVGAKQVLCFANYGSEPNTLNLIEQCLSESKLVFCPRIIGDVMEFYEITSLSELSTGYKGIPEPPVSKRYVPGACDFLVVPGVAFDRCGNRIGYGKGFYDRFFQSGYKGAMAALAFSMQIVEEGRIPVEPTDIKITRIVTENEIILT